MSTHSESLSMLDNTVKLQIVNPEGLYDPTDNGYSHAVITSGGSKVAYIAGQGAEFADGKQGFPPTIEGQLQQAFNNLMIAVKAVGGRPEHVVKINTYFVNYDMSMLEPLGAEISKHFAKAIPAQTLVPVPKLAIDGMLFEVDAVVILE